MNKEPSMSLPEVSWKLPDRYDDPKFWVRGDKAKNGAQSDKLIHLGVGHALSNWEHVESSIAMLFSFLVESHSIAGIRAYGTINGSRGREAALRQASDAFFSLRKTGHRQERIVYEEINKFEKTTNSLIHNYGLASARRADIAHGISYNIITKKDDKDAWFLVVPNYQSVKTKNWIDDDIKLMENKGMRLSSGDAYFDYNKFYYKNSQYVYSTNELKVFAGKFIYLYADILCLLHMFNHNKFKIAPEQLYALARKMSE